MKSNKAKPIHSSINHSIIEVIVFFSFQPSLSFLATMATVQNTNDCHNTFITINVATQTPLKLTSNNYLS